MVILFTIFSCEFKYRSIKFESFIKLSQRGLGPELNIASNDSLYPESNGAVVNLREKEYVNPSTDILVSILRPISISHGINTKPEFGSEYK